MIFLVAPDLAPRMRRARLGPMLEVPDLQLSSAILQQSMLRKESFGWGSTSFSRWSLLGTTLNAQPLFPEVVFPFGRRRFDSVPYKHRYQTQFLAVLHLNSLETGTSVLAWATGSCQWLQLLSFCSKTYQKKTPCLSSSAPAPSAHWKHWHRWVHALEDIGLQTASTSGK